MDGFTKRPAPASVGRIDIRVGTDGTGQASGYSATRAKVQLLDSEGGQVRVVVVDDVLPHLPASVRAAGKTFLDGIHAVATAGLL